MSQNHWELILLIIASLIFIFFFDKAKVPAALLSGTLVASGVLQIFDIASYKLPDASINFCLLILEELKNLLPTLQVLLISFKLIP